MALNKKRPEANLESEASARWPTVSLSRKATTRQQEARLAVAAEARLAPTGRGEEIPFNDEYVRRLREGDPEVENHFDRCFRQRLRMKLSHHRLQESDKQDVIQETLLQVMRAVQNDAIRSPESFGGFVFGVCSNVLAGYWPIKEVELEDIDIADPAEDSEKLLLCREREKLVESVLSELKPKDRNLLRAKLFEQLSAEEMIARFGASSSGHLRLLLHRARKQFEKACKKKGVDFFID
jgi:RNA polymerase sigma factor (sigma-70 family)